MKKWEVYGYPDGSHRSPLLGIVYAVSKASANEEAARKFGELMYVVCVE